jgi:hypothetical protein
MDEKIEAGQHVADDRLNDLQRYATLAHHVIKE